MPDTLSREELAAIRERDWLTEHNQAYELGWSHSERDRRALLRHIDALTAAEPKRLRLALLAIHGGVVPLPNRPTVDDYAAMIWKWMNDLEVIEASSDPLD